MYLRLEGVLAIIEADYLMGSALRCFEQEAVSVCQNVQFIGSYDGLFHHH